MAGTPRLTRSRALLRCASNGIAVIARYRRDRKGKTLPHINMDDTDQKKIGCRIIWKRKVLTQSVFDSCSFAPIRGCFFLICDHLRKSAAIIFFAFLNTSKTSSPSAFPLAYFAVKDDRSKAACVRPAVCTFHHGQRGCRFLISTDRGASGNSGKHQRRSSPAPPRLSH